MSQQTLYQSHFAVYALIPNAAGDRVLLIKKRLGCYTGLYDLPGGSMEAHELLEDTLHREVREETDCTLTHAEQLGTFSVLYPHRRDGVAYTLRHIAAIYLGTVSGTPRMTGASPPQDDSDGCVWLHPQDLTDANATPLVLQAVRAWMGKSQRS